MRSEIEELFFIFDRKSISNDVMKVMNYTHLFRVRLQHKLNMRSTTFLYKVTGIRETRL